jgi:hypothetical protein
METETETGREGKGGQHDKHRDPETEREIVTDRGRQTDRHSDRQSEKHRDREGGRQVALLTRRLPYSPWQ